MVFFRRLWLPTTLMIATVVASNIAVQFPINDWLTWGAVTYPVSFLITDLTNRRYGPTDARRVAYVGFAIAVALSFHFADWRIATASGLAFLSAQLLDVWIFNRLRRSSWWRAPLASSTVASAWDTAVFFTVAFAGSGLPWMTWAVGDYMVKLVMALTMLIPFRALMDVIAARAEAQAGSR